MPIKPFKLQTHFFKTTYDSGKYSQITPRGNFIHNKFFKQEYIKTFQHNLSEIFETLNFCSDKLYPNTKA